MSPSSSKSRAWSSLAICCGIGSFRTIATPSRLPFHRASAQGFANERRSYIPGHGPRPEPGELESYLNLVDEIEAVGRRSFEKGVSPAEAAAEFKLPESVSDWTLFNDSYFEVAIRAWHKELGGSC